MNNNITWPLEKNIIRRGSIRHTFGMVRRHADGSKRPHQGWDFYAETGTACYAISDGIIVSNRNFGAYGQRILLKFQHDFEEDGTVDTLYAFYAHLSASFVKIGQNVKKGAVIGETGNSGNAKNMQGEDQHLHFEIHTKRWVTRGLKGRISPLNIFAVCPLKSPPIMQCFTTDLS